MAQITTTDGKIYIFGDECDCGLTGGCFKCNISNKLLEKPIRLKEE